MTAISARCAGCEYSAEMNPAAREVTPAPWPLVGSVALALFVDYFLYGAVIPLAPHAPAGIIGEDQIALLFAVYAASVLVVTPFFGYFGDRLGPRFMMLTGAALTAAAALLFGIGSS